MTPDGTDVRYLYYNPSHHSWQDDNHILDYGRHTPPGGIRVNHPQRFRAATASSG